MEHQFPMEQGMMTCSDFGNRVELVMNIKNDRRGLYKGWIRGAGGQVLELGTLIPEGSCLMLRRCLQMDRLQQAGYWPISSCGVSLLHRFAGQDLSQGWKREEDPGRLIPHDPFLREEVSRCSGGLLCVSREGFSLAFPYSNKKPFPVEPLFCFARIRNLGEGQYAVFPFDKEGRPRRA